MGESYESNKYMSFKIPDRQQVQKDGDIQPRSKTDTGSISAIPDGMFYEIEYDSCPVPGAGKFVLKSQKIVEPEKDEIRDLFSQMRDIARAHRSTYDISRFFDKHVQQDNAMIFYKQGMFMKDYEDDYSGNVSFSQYFPYYQMMGYEQLRTYFAWRTQVRLDNITDTSLSYAFLYIYELLANIGVDNPLDGLNKLMSFWKGFNVYNKSIDKYMLRWLKDYHIYYELPHSFKDFVEKNNLLEHYPKVLETNANFDLFCAISKYDIRKSVFFTDDTGKMIIDCFSFVINRIKRDFEAAGISFDDVIFYPKRNLVTWKPFKDALFYQWYKQPDRRIVLSENEIYMCNNNEWTFSTVITTENGRQFIGYVMKQMEAVLRKITKFKFKIKANISVIDEETINKMIQSGLFIDKIVSDAVMDFHRESTKTIVVVDHASLDRIRQEALLTQEALIVEEQIEQRDNSFDQISITEKDQSILTDLSETAPILVSNIWVSLKDALSEDELRALAVILNSGDIKAFADECGVMLEVLIDGINEKAMDYIGDNIMDEEFVLYDDYKDQVKELIG